MVAAVPAAAATNERPRVGNERPRVVVVELLRALSATGDNVLYSSELVPASLDAPDSMPHGDPLQRVAAALAANGLTLQRTDATTYVVSRSAATAPPAAAAVAAPVPHSRSTLDEIPVFASRYEFTTESGEPTAFDRREIDEMPGAKTDSVRALRTAPGLATNNSARPYIRGAQLDDVLVMYDGIALADPFHFRDFQSVMSVFNPSTVSRADVYTGGYPVNYGTRSGGVIDLVPATVASGDEYGVGANLLSYELETVGHADGLPVDWLLVARTSSDDRVLQRLIGKEGEPSFYDAVGHLRWAVDDASVLALGWLILGDKVTFIDGDVGEGSAVGRSRESSAWLRWDWTPDSRLQARTSLALTDTDHDTRGTLSLAGTAQGTLHAEQRFSSLALRSDWTFKPAATLRLDFGGEFNRENAELEFVRQEMLSAPVAAAFGRPPDASVVSNQSPHSSTFAVYSAAHRRWQAFEAEIGLRLDAQDYRGYGLRRQLTPRVNLRYDFFDRWHAYASWGQFTQSQRVDEFRTEANQMTPDPAIRATHVIGGVTRETEDSMTWRLEAYRHHWASMNPYFDNALGLISPLPQLEPDRVLVVPSDAEAAGLEISVQRSFAHGFSAWGNYSLSTITDDVHGREVPRSWDQPHAAGVGLAWTRHGLSASALVNWHSNWPKTPTRVVPASATEPAYLVVGARNSSRGGSYFTTDLRLSQAVPLQSGELSLWLDGTNITNRSNTCCVDLDAMNSAQASAMETKIWSPRLINVGFTFKVRRNE